MAAISTSLVKSIDAGVSETRRVVKSLSDGDLTDSMRGDFKGAFAELQENFNGTMQTLQSTMGKVRKCQPAHMNDGASELSSAANDLSKRTEQQAQPLKKRRPLSIRSPPS